MAPTFTPASVVVSSVRISNAVLINQDNTIEGSGNIGGQQLALVNRGVIDGNASSTLLIRPSAGQPGAGGVTNQGLIQASNGGHVLFELGTIDNSAGTIQALSGSTIEIGNATTISGGILKALDGGTVGFSDGAIVQEETLVGAGSGVFDLILGYSTARSPNPGAVTYGTLDDVVISAATNFEITNGQIAALQGTITNIGNIALTTTGQNGLATAQIVGTVTLAGGGTVTLSSNGADIHAGFGGRFIGQDLNAVLINQDNTIEGSGNIGDHCCPVHHEYVVRKYLIFNGFSAIFDGVDLKLASDSGTLFRGGPAHVRRKDGILAADGLPALEHVFSARRALRW